MIKETETASHLFKIKSLFILNKISLANKKSAKFLNHIILNSYQNYLKKMLNNILLLF